MNPRKTCAVPPVASRIICAAIPVSVVLARYESSRENVTTVDPVLLQSMMSVFPGSRETFVIANPHLPDCPMTHVSDGFLEVNRDVQCPTPMSERMQIRVHRTVFLCLLVPVSFSFSHVRLLVGRPNPLQYARARS